MEAIINVTNTAVKTFYSEYNCGKSSAKEYLPHCRASVERYLFSKLYERLFEMYKIKYEEEDKSLSLKRETLGANKGIKLMKTIGVRAITIQFSRFQKNIL